MAAPQLNNTPRTRRKEVEFPPNVPVTISLAYSEPRRVPSMNGGERCMYTTTDNQVMFVPAEVAGRISELAINVRVPFTITKKSSGKRGEPEAWEVGRIAGEQPDGTFAAPKLPEPPADDATPAPAKPMQRAATAQGGALAEEANALVDIYAEVLHRALTKHEGRVKPDEVRSLLVTAYIQRRQLSSVA